MREELKQLQKKLNISMIFVTHDQEEALSLSDKIVVMNMGEIIQIGTPEEIYYNPTNDYVADFIGKANFITKDGKKVLLRPEDISMRKSENGEWVIVSKEFMGAYTIFKIKNSQSELYTSIQGEESKNFKINETGFLKIGLNNAFSLEELQELIQSYNRLYSLFYYICQNGTDLINRNNINDISSRYSMVLESIHIGSEGVLVSVGVELIVDIIKSFIKSVYDLNRTEAEKRKKELIEKAELAEFVQTRQYIYQLIDILDAYLQKRESGCNPMVMAYIENEINNIVRKIEQLQGTKHIDLAI